MITKTCSKCKIAKNPEEFGKHARTKNGLRHWCKLCKREDDKKYKIAYRENNKDKIKQYRELYYNLNKEKELHNNKIYKTLNKESIANYNKTYIKNRAKEDILFKLRITIRKRLNKEISKNRWNKNNTLSHYLGCSLEQLKIHLENQFQPGMTWENHGQYGWHIDHKIPLIKAKSEKELYILSHFSNLQPLWAIDNLLKGDKI